MTDYMTEAERLSRVLEGIAQTALRGVENEQIRGHLMDAAALLAHIQRGAVPEGDDGKRVLREVFALCEDTEAKCYEDPSDFNRGRSFEAKGIARAIGAWYQEEFCGRTHMGEPAAVASDQFRNAAKMMTVQPSCMTCTAPAPTDVPMPEPDTHCYDEDERDADAFRAAVRLGLCVNCYTSSDCMADGSAAVEIYTPEIADSIHVKAIPDPYAAARSAVFAAANKIDALRVEVKP